MTNRLGNAVSPYLRSHADNPVHWWQWSDEAFAEAARRDVPVMVSIGYATCHWCHVMARETFSDPEVAAYLNENLVAIKVDREEHPEVDAAFLAAASAFTQNLGWPLTVFATPEGLTFFAGTYFPPRATQGMPAFRQVVDAVLEAWRDKRDDVVAAGTAVRDAVAAARPAAAVGSLGGGDFDQAVARLLSLEDPE
ncbi:MAG: thioredoxin domain-containing protein, partial [Pseudolysinimonas sp.]